MFTNCLFDLLKTVDFVEFYRISGLLYSIVLKYFYYVIRMSTIY